MHLVVRRFLDLEALEHGIQLWSFRVWAQAQFKTADGWTSVLPALIDTGAPFSVLPKTLWGVIHYEERFSTTLRGLVPLPSAVLRARCAQVTCAVRDSQTRSMPLTFWALLADGNVPLVLGCAGVLDRAKFVLEASRTSASLEF